MPKSGALPVEFLEAYGEAWNDHDPDWIMAALTEDCIFETGGGESAWGDRHEGADAVRARVE